MAGNVFGKLLQISTFGESHGPAIGCVVDGFPAGIEIDLHFIQSELLRRRPGQSKIVTQRKENDIVRILSGVFEGKSTGAPIALLIENEDQRSGDYSHLSDVYRPSHADFTWQSKFGTRDYRGGGRTSARETAARVAAGALAKILLRQHGIRIQAYVSQVGQIRMEQDYQAFNIDLAEENDVRCPDPILAEKMIALIQEVRKAGDTVGGVVSALITGCPPGLGEPVFDKLHADLGKAMLSINAAKGFEYGSGFEGVSMRGSAHNDAFLPGADKDHPVTRSNFSGGIQGGISNGMDIYFRVAFKPVATIVMEQDSVNMAGEPVKVSGKGRHDPCVAPRAVPIVEAMAALILADHLLRQRALR